MPDTAAPSTALASLPSPVGGVPHWLVPNSIQECEIIAAKMCAAEWLPYSYKNKRTQEYDRNKVELAIMHGATVGIPAIMAPQVIAVIGNVPTVWGDGMLGLVLSSGLAEDIKEYYEGEGEELTAYCIAKRRGIPSPAEGKYSVAIARKAGLMTKEGPWQTNPARMLKMRARAFALRDRFADILKGLRMAEEVLDEMIDVTPTATADSTPQRRPKPEDFKAVKDIDPEPQKPRSARKAKEEAPAVPEPVDNIVDVTEKDAPPSVEDLGRAIHAFTLVSVSGEFLPYEDIADFRKAYTELLQEAFKEMGLAGGEGFLETNRAMFLRWAKDHGDEAVELDTIAAGLARNFAPTDDALAITDPRPEPPPAAPRPPVSPANRRLF